MGIREDREFLKSRRHESEMIRENAEKKSREDFNNSVIRREELIAMGEAKIDNYCNYKDNVKKTLVKEALFNIYANSIVNPGRRELALCDSLLEQYIEETTVPKLLRNMRFSTSGLLHNIYEETEEYFKKITAGTTADDPESQTIDPGDVEDFWKDIDSNEDIEDITNTIRLRVSNAEEDFINKNQEDKEDIKSILADTNKRIQMSKMANDNDYEEAVAESESRIAKRKIGDIQHERYHNVFDRMVRNLSEAAIKNSDAKKEFTLENGRLDMDKIVESARCMYTLLEMVSTIQLEKVDQKYIEDTLKSIK